MGALGLPWWQPGGDLPFRGMRGGATASWKKPLASVCSLLPRVCPPTATPHLFWVQ